jgi:general secretion pathway protein F
VNTAFLVVCAQQAIRLSGRVRLELKGKPEPIRKRISLLSMQFQYVALDPEGQRRKGSMAADSEQTAVEMLQLKNWQVVSLHAQILGAAAQGPPRRSANTAQSTALLTDELATLLEAGVPLAEALATLAHGGEGTSAGHAALGRVLASVRGGSAFSAALAHEGMGLPNYALQLVRAGESTGNLAAALRSAAEHLEADRAFAEDARSALIYPAVLIGSGLLAVLVMFIFVVPRFATILDNPKADLPWMSKLVLGAGAWVTQHQLLVFLGLAALAVSVLSVARLPQARVLGWELAARLPVLGAWVSHAEIARWASLFGVLLNSRVPLLTSLGQANQTLRQKNLRGRADLVLSDVRGGKTLSLALGDHSLLDATGLNLIRVGERAGVLGATVTSLAKMHNNQSRTRLKRFLVLLEPVAILLISVVLGSIMISVMLAITSLTNVL